MSKFLKKFAGAALIAALAGPVLAGGFGLGRDALPEEIAAWDLDVSPDGTGLPAGSGSVADGERIFEESCAACHGSFAEGVDNWPKLAGGKGTLANADPVKTVGSYWPYLSTTWDYINRSMPFGNAQSLEPDQVYAIVAYILYSNDLVDDDFVLSQENFLDVELPNSDGFIIDNRAEVEIPELTGEPCMTGCKDSVEITMRARVLDVTPDTGVDEDTTEIKASLTEPEVPAEGPDPELVAAGEKVFRKCKACHQIGEGAKNRSGPLLTGIVGRPVAKVDGFRYSGALEGMAADGLVWTPETLTAFLENPKGFAKGTKMSFKGLSDAEDLSAMIAYLSTFPE